MHSRALELLNLLGMRQHPEGGHYVEVFRSAHRVRPLDRDVERAALTAIYFLLAAHVLLQRTRRPNADDVREALAGNLCRCTGYTKIIEAVLSCTR